MTWREIFFPMNQKSEIKKGMMKIEGWWLVLRSQRPEARGDEVLGQCSSKVPFAGANDMILRRSQLYWSLRKVWKNQKILDDIELYHYDKPNCQTDLNLCLWLQIGGILKEEIIEIEWNAISFLKWKNLKLFINLMTDGKDSTLLSSRTWTRNKSTRPDTRHKMRFRSYW